MIYEGVLLFGVSFIVGYAMLALLHWTYPLTAYQRWLLQIALFLAFGAYFVSSWTRIGQTLAMKAWHLRVTDRNGRRVSLRTAILRYLLAWTLFLPGLLFVALVQTHAAWDALVLAIGFIAMLSVGQVTSDRQLLHDRWLGTRVTRDPPR
jgi:uncharacterized RDD family membrane protein YckC